MADGMPGWLVSLALSHFTMVTFLLMRASVAPCWERPFPWAGHVERRGAEGKRGLVQPCWVPAVPPLHGSSCACRAARPVLLMCGSVHRDVE